MLTKLTTLLTQLRNSRQQKKETREKESLARCFNRLYTYHASNRYFAPTQRLPGTAVFGLLPEDTAAWMCPKCNRIHRPVSCSAFSGLQFPACCSFPKGHRLGDHFATGRN